MYKSTYLMDTIYFGSFDEAKNYYDHPEAEDVFDLNEILRVEYDGMVSPIIEITEAGYEAFVNAMDDDLREELHAELAPCSNEEFLERYKEEHEKRFGEEFQI